MITDIESLETAKRRRAWSLGTISLLLLLLFLPLSWGLGWMRIFPGPRYAALHSLAFVTIAFPLFWLAVHVSLVLPFVQGFLKPEHKPVRLLVPILIWGLPLLSFAYWQGDFRGALHAYDAAVFIFSALVIPLILYWRTGAALFLSFAIGLIAFFPLFIIEDILGPFSPLFVYASEGPGVYNLRTLSVTAALLVAGLGPIPHIGRVPHRAQTFLLSLLGVGFLSFASFAIEWGSVDEMGRTRFFSPELGWLGLLALAYFNTRPEKFAQRSFEVLSLILAGSLSVGFVYGLFHPDASLGGQVRLLSQALALTLIGSELRRRIFMKRRGRFTGERSVPNNVRLATQLPSEAV